MIKDKVMETIKMENSKKVYVTVYVHCYGNDPYTEVRVFDSMEKANERMKMYARDIYDENKCEEDFDDWCFYHSDWDGLSFDDENGSIYNVHIVEEDVE